MRIRGLAILGAVCMALSGWPAAAQIGTPGNAPLTPDGPRRGLGPPSITDSVPDLRLHAPGGGIPGAGPPISGGSGSGGVSRATGLGVAPERPIARRRAPGIACATSSHLCAAPQRAAIGAACSCRLPDGMRLRGRVRR